MTTPKSDFFQGEGLFLADVLKEQVLLSLPMKVICQSDCRGLCPTCGRESQSRRVPLRNAYHGPASGSPRAGLKQDWLKKTIDFRAKSP